MWNWNSLTKVTWKNCYKLDVHCMGIFSVIFREQTCGKVVCATAYVFSSGEICGIASIAPLYHWNWDYDFLY
jgi:hypothetical protein